MSEAWECLQVDLGHLQHEQNAVTFIALVDEATRYLVAHVVCARPRAQTFNPKTTDVVTLIRNLWMCPFGAPRTIRSDQEGACSSQRFASWCHQLHIALELVPAEDHYRMGLVERCIGKRLSLNHI